MKNKQKRKHRTIRGKRCPRGTRRRLATRRRGGGMTYNSRVPSSDCFSELGDSPNSPITKKSHPINIIYNINTLTDDEKEQARLWWSAMKRKQFNSDYTVIAHRIASQRRGMEIRKKLEKMLKDRNTKKRQN